MNPLRNRPHIVNFLNHEFMQFIITHIQNFCWTMDRWFGRPIVYERYPDKISDSDPWVLPDYKSVMIAHEHFSREPAKALHLDVDKRINIAVLVPSRLALSGTDGDYIYNKAVNSILNQSVGLDVKFTIIVAVDVDAKIPVSGFAKDVTFVKSMGRSQALALNAGIDAIPPEADYIAILEDDDQWRPNYLSWALAALTLSDFVSSNQIEHNEFGDIVKVNDFPTPSGWIMRTKVLKQIGKFDPSFKWHLDNEWLGRLGRSGLKRCHLVECNAPTSIRAAEGRHHLAYVLVYGGDNSFVYRHALESPLVYRMMHSQSGMHAIRTDSVAAQLSTDERARLTARYGYMPH